MGNIDYKEVGRRIASRRKELGLKQYELCELLDVNYKYISNLETGRSAPSLELLMSLCDVLQTTPDHFLVGAEKGELILRRLELKANALSEKNKILLDGILDLMLEQQENRDLFG